MITLKYRGVNMFAMLTASLPFTTESTEIADLYQKIANFQINPVPDSLSEGILHNVNNFQFLVVNIHKINLLSKLKASYVNYNKMHDFLT